MSLYLADLGAGGVTRAPVATVDPTRSHARITFEGAAAEPLGPAGAGWPLVERLLDRAAVLVAFEQVGGAQAALEMGRDYALGRFAFGRPIGSFQAIKHKLADVYVAVELARSNAYYAAWALSTEAAELPVAAAARAGGRERGLLPRRQGEYPDPRRHGLHLGVRLPHVLSPRQAARARRSAAPRAGRTSSSRASNARER